VFPDSIVVPAIFTRCLSQIMAQTGQSYKLPLKNTVTLVNTFVIQTTQFLNHFSALAEEKLAAVSANVARLEKVLLLLETKIYRPDADEAVNESKTGAGDGGPSSSPEVVPTAASGASAPVDPTPPAATFENIPSMPAPPPVPAPAPEQNPEWETYLKMKKMGVPRGAIEQKMQKDGVDSTGFPWD
jgi:Subunit CCDC53 of WASH complex